MEGYEKELREVGIGEQPTGNKSKLNDGLVGLVNLWQERASALWNTSQLVEESNPTLASQLHCSGLAYDQCADELLKLKDAD